MPRPRRIQFAGANDHLVTGRSPPLPLARSCCTAFRPIRGQVLEVPRPSPWFFTSSTAELFAATCSTRLTTSRHLNVCCQKRYASGRCEFVRIVGCLTTSLCCGPKRTGIRQLLCSNEPIRTSNAGKSIVMRRGMVRRNQGRDKSFPVQYALVGAKVTASFLSHGTGLDRRTGLTWATSRRRSRNDKTCVIAYSGQRHLAMKIG